MWTVLWKDGEKDRWDRFETEDEVRELLDQAGRESRCMRRGCMDFPHPQQMTLH